MNFSNWNFFTKWTTMNNVYLIQICNIENVNCVEKKKALCVVFYFQVLKMYHYHIGTLRGHDRMIIGFTTTYEISFGYFHQKNWPPDITEILLKVASNTITLTPIIMMYLTLHLFLSISPVVVFSELRQVIYMLLKILFGL